MLKDTLIIFTHHYNDSKISDKYNLLKLLNESCDVISAGFIDHKKNLIPNSIIVDPNKKYFPKNNKLSSIRPKTHINWTQIDLILYEIYQLYPDYKKYFLVEYDTIFNCAINIFFPRINELNHFGSNIHNSLSKNWIFVKKYEKYNNTIKLNDLASIGQATCIYLENQILSNVVKEIEKNNESYHNMFSELRLGTLIKKFTNTLFKGRDDIRNFISWKQENISIDLSLKNFFYHPVK